MDPGLRLCHERTVQPADSPSNQPAYGCSGVASSAPSPERDTKERPRRLRPRSPKPRAPIRSGGARPEITRLAPFRASPTAKDGGRQTPERAESAPLPNRPPSCSSLAFSRAIGLEAGYERRAEEDVRKLGSGPALGRTATRRRRLVRRAFRAYSANRQSGRTLEARARRGGCEIRGWGRCAGAHAYLCSFS